MRYRQNTLEEHQHIKIPTHCMFRCWKITKIRKLLNLWPLEAVESRTECYGNRTSEGPQLSRHRCTDFPACEARCEPKNTGWARLGTFLSLKATDSSGNSGKDEKRFPVLLFRETSAKKSRRVRKHFRKWNSCKTLMICSKACAIWACHAYGPLYEY